MNDPSTHSRTLREERSLAMLKKGIEPALDSDGVFWIASQTQRGKKYRVTRNERGWCECECPDNRKGNLCKHILLLKLYLESRDSTRAALGRARAKRTITKPCPSCDSENLQKDGTRKTTLGRKQRWLCLDCGKRFVVQPISGIKGDLESVCLAMDLYMKGVSYRGIQDSLRQFLGLRIHHVTIMRWIQKFMEKIGEYVDTLQPEVSKTWHADEQWVNIRGHFQYLWNCMDSETRFLLANQVTPVRSTADARALFREAKKIAQGKAEKVITDGAFAYEDAVKKEFSTYRNPKPHLRYVSLKEKSSNNNRLERYHGSFRQRDKTMRAFKSVEGTQKYAKNFRTYYNFVRPHTTLGKTPAEAANLKTPNSWKELLEKAMGAEKN